MRSAVALCALGWVGCAANVAPQDPPRGMFCGTLGPESSGWTEFTETPTVCRWDGAHLAARIRAGDGRGITVLGTVDADGGFTGRADGCVSGSASDPEVTDRNLPCEGHAAVTETGVLRVYVRCLHPNGERVEGQLWLWNCDPYSPGVTGEGTALDCR